MKSSTRFTVPYTHVAGFSTDGRGGNEAGVVLPADNAVLSDKQRLAVAAELARHLGFSETVFVGTIRTLGSSVELALRYFTPVAEVECCGHAAIACIGLLHDRGFLSGAMEGTLSSRAGTVGFQVRSTSAGLAVDTSSFGFEGALITAPLSRRHTLIFTEQLSPSIDAPLSATDTRAVSAALGGTDGGSTTTGVPLGSAPVTLDAAWAPRVASTGLRDLLVGLSPGSDLQVLRPDMERISEMSRSLGTVGMHVFCATEPGSTDDTPSAVPGCEYRCRNFAPLFGVDEESATSTSNCALACALWDSGAAQPGRALSFAQGESIGQPSRITVLPPTTRASTDESERSLLKPWVGGEFRCIGSSEVLLPAEAPPLYERTQSSTDPVSREGSTLTITRAAGEEISEPLSIASDSARGKSRWCSVPQLHLPPPGGCQACIGAKRGARGETFCRRCGRAYVKPRTWRDDMRTMAGDGVHAVSASASENSWCDLVVGRAALWLHNFLIDARRRSEIRHP